MDPAHQDDRPLNGPAKAQKRPALITIKNRNNSETCDARGFRDRKYFQSTKFPYKAGGKELEATKSYPTVIPTTLPPATSLLSREATRQQAWQHIIQPKNLRELPQAETIFDQERVTRAVKWAISDSGATGQFLIAGVGGFDDFPVR